MVKTIKYLVVILIFGGCCINGREKVENKLSDELIGFIPYSSNDTLEFYEKDEAIQLIITESYIDINEEDDINDCISRIDEILLVNGYFTKLSISIKIELIPDSKGTLTFIIENNTFGANYISQDFCSMNWEYLQCLEYYISSNNDTIYNVYDFINFFNLHDSIIQNHLYYNEKLGIIGLELKEKNIALELNSNHSYLNFIP